MPHEPSYEFRREYLLRLPLPLAQLYSRAHNAKDNRSRHDNCYYIFESLIKLAACPLIGSYIDDLNRGRPHVESIDRTLSYLALPSLGQWVAMLRELARHYGNSPEHKGHPLRNVWRKLNRKHTRAESPAIVGLYRRIKHGPDGKLSADSTCTLLDLFDKVVRYRNDVVGHGGPRFEDFFDNEMGPLMFPAVNEVLAEGTFDPLGAPGTRLVYLTEMRMVGEGKFEVSLRELVGLQGERSAPMVFDHDMVKALAPRYGAFPGLALIWPGHAAPLRLGPMMRFRESEVADEVLLLNRDRGGRQVEYLSYTTGRTERDAEMSGAMAHILSVVTAKEITEDQLRAFEKLSRSEGDSIEGLVGDSRLDGTSGAPRLGDYELLAELGRGGMGVVYLARQASLGRVVALKTLPGDLSSNERALARFRREMRVLGNCDHPNIVKLLDSGTLDDGQMYYTMEYVPGADLEQVWKELSSQTCETDVTDLDESVFAQALDAASRHKRRDVATRYERTLNPLRRRDEAGDENPLVLPPLPLPELPAALRDPSDRAAYVRRIVGMIRDAALALHTVHAQGVIHRDVSPGNLMVTPDGNRIVLMDFGLAKGGGESMSMSIGTGFMGKLRYAAPEQLASAVLEVGAPADVRGLGATLWELVTRQRLFGEARDERALATLIHQKDVPRLREVDPGFDRDLEAIVARATEREVPKRIGSAKLLAEYLQMYLDGAPLPIRPPTTGELFARWVRRKKALVGSLAFAFAAVSLILVFAFNEVNKRAHDAQVARDQALDSRAEAEASLEQTRAALSGVFETITESDVFRGTGLYGPQRELLAEIVGHYETVLRDNQDDAQLKFDLARTLRILAETSLQVGKVEEAERHAIKADGLLRGLSSEDAVYESERASLLVVRSRIYLGLGPDHYDAGIDAATQAVNMLIPLVARPDNRDEHAAMASACQSLGDLSYARTAYPEALDWYRAAATTRWQFYERDDPPRRIPADELAEVQLQIARTFVADGEPDQARVIYASVIDILEPFQDTSRPLTQRITAPMRLKLAVAQRSYANLVKPEDRLDRLQASVDIIRQLAGDSPDVSLYQIELARSLLDLARLQTLSPGQDVDNTGLASIERNRREQVFDELMSDVLPRLKALLPGNKEVELLEADTYASWAQFQGIDHIDPAFEIN
ncbi:MAG: serine/threonine-protein kinase [Planctomycetota bacterium]